MLPDNESEDVNDNILSDLCDMDVKNVYSCEDAITNRLFLYFIYNILRENIVFYVKI